MKFTKKELNALLDALRVLSEGWPKGGEVPKMAFPPSDWVDGSH